MSEIKTGHPKGLYVLFVTEMWERFSYYGMRAIFALFLTKALLYDKAFASGIYGSYTGLVYLTPLLGGYVADRYWGNRKSIIFGGFLMAIGQFLMFISGSVYEQVDLSRTIMFGGLGFLIFGNGFFKPNISTMVGQLYPKGDMRVDSAFTIFYMGINLGAFFSPLICGGLGDTGSPADFKWGFLAAGIGMLVSTFLFIWLKNYYIVTPDGQPIGAAPNKNRQEKEVADTSLDNLKENTPLDYQKNNAKEKEDFTLTNILTWTGIAIVLGCIFYFLLDFDIFGCFIFSLTICAPGLILSDGSLSKIERDRIWVIYIVAFFVIFFWSAFEQAGASLTFFAEEQTDRGIDKTLTHGMAIGGLIAIILIMVWLVAKVMKKMKSEQKGVKEIFLVLLLGIIGACVYGITSVPAEGIYIESVPASFFQSINAVAIVIFAPLFALLWTFLGKRKIEPASPYKQAIGLFLLALGYLVIAFGVKDLSPEAKVTPMWLISLYLIHTYGELCLSPIGLSMVNKLAPVKFASLLMGVWFLSTSAANKFAGMLSALYPEGGKTTSFLGYQIANLYDFFMLFVIMAGVASIILFVLCSKMLKMMHNIR